MIVNIVSQNEYERSLSDPIFVYNTSKFCELNKHKVNILNYLIISKGNSPRFALYLGINDDKIAKCPFSAPFGMLTEIKGNADLNNYDEAIEAIDNYATDNGIKGLFFTLPPFFYSEHEITALLNVFYRNNYILTNVDINYSFDLSTVYSPDYEVFLHRNAKKNLRIALSSSLLLKRCETLEEINTAYNIIAQNRKSKGYPLRMSYKQVLDTIAIVENDVFLVQQNNSDIAAALVYRVNDKIAQVIYWGDNQSFKEFKPINYLAYKLIQYYGEQQFEYLDIGPSTEDSIPNYGLCDFKESIACKRSLKISVHKFFN